MPDFDLPRHNDRRQKKRDKRRQKKTKISAAAAVTGTEPAPFAFVSRARKSPERVFVRRGKHHLTPPPPT